MGGNMDDRAGPSVGDWATIHIRCSNGNKFLVKASLSSTVGALKATLVEKSTIPVDRQRLIYRGRVLKDDDSLESYGLHDDHTVHLVRGAPSLVAVDPVAVPTPTSSEASGGFIPPNSLSVGGLSSLDGASSRVGGSAGGPGFGLTLPEFQQVQQQLMQNPDLIREMMNMPTVQSLMNNPELMRTLIMSNPQMSQIIDRNPDLAHILNDPGTLRQTLDAARNPELMREMMRNTDRAMSNIEASPEGFNMLRRMYETVQEPLLNAATIGADAAGEFGANPFGALEGQELSSTPDTDRSTSTTPQSTLNSTATPSTLPNSAPLPNPWDSQRTASRGHGPPQALPGSILSPQLRALTAALYALPEFGGSDRSQARLDPQALQQMLQNPTVQQMMRGLLSNPQYIDEVLNPQPRSGVSQSTNPQLIDMQLLRHQQTRLNLRWAESQLDGQQALSPESGHGGDLGLSTLRTMFGALGSSRLPGPLRGTSESAELLYASQLSQLQEMGFVDIQENLQALTETGGDVHAAVQWLLGNPA